MDVNKNFSYLIRITIGVNQSSILVKNKKEVPMSLLETMAKEKITRNINLMYSSLKYYRTENSVSFFNKMIKQSDFEIEDLNEIEVFDLHLTFDNENIKNNTDERKRREIRQSSINKEKSS